MSDARAQSVADQAYQLGFNAVGISRAAVESAQVAADFAEAKDQAPALMPWLYDTLAMRLDARHLLEGAQSVVVVGANYHFPAKTGPAHENAATIASYARGRDYHRWFASQLKKLAAHIETLAGEGSTRIAVDTKPIAEKAFAQQAGLGWQGKHTHLVSPEFGSWLLLGAVVTTIALPPDAPARDQCGSCHACIDACPTDALDQPRRMKVAACIAYLTIEHRGSIPIQYRRAVGTRVFGCDDCLAACPWNKFAQQSRIADFKARQQWDSPALEELARWDRATFLAKTEGNPIRRARYEGFVRNVIIALANSVDAQTPPVQRAQVHAALDAHRASPDPVIAETYAWAIQELEEKAV